MARNRPFYAVESKQFGTTWRHILDDLAPKDVRAIVNQVARDLRKELEAASPRGPAPSARRAAKRAQFPKGDYGPISESWRISRASKRNFATATVYTTAFYAPMVEYGTVNMRAQPFVGPVHDRVRDIAMASAKKVAARIRRREERMARQARARMAVAA